MTDQEVDALIGRIAETLIGETLDYYEARAAHDVEACRALVRDALKPKVPARKRTALELEINGATPRDIQWMGLNGMLSP